MLLKRLKGLRGGQSPADGAALQPSSTLTHEHVRWAYRLFLDRESESESVLSRKLTVWQTTQELRRDFLSSEEFKARNADDFGAIDIEKSIVITELTGGLRIFLNLSDHMVGLKILRGQYETEELLFVRRNVQPGHTVLDVGANIGFFTVHMAALVGELGKIYAFEPISDNVDLLRRSITENQFDSRVVLEPCGVGEASGVGHFVFLPTERSANSGGAYLNKGSSPLPPGHETKTAQIVSLDEYNLRRPVNFIKIDVEGAEPLAFRGARNLLREDRPIVLAEINSPQLKIVANCGPKELVDEMREYGYECRAVTNGESGPVLSDPSDITIRSVVFRPRERFT